MSNNKEDNSNKNEKNADSIDNQTSPNEEEIGLMKSYSVGPYDDSIKDLEKGVKIQVCAIDKAMGVKESDRGLAPSSQWDLNSDKTALQSGNFSFSVLVFFFTTGSSHRKSRRNLLRE